MPCRDLGNRLLCTLFIRRVKEAETCLNYIRSNTQSRWMFVLYKYYYFLLHVFCCFGKVVVWHTRCSNLVIVSLSFPLTFGYTLTRKLTLNCSAHVHIFNTRLCALVVYTRVGTSSCPSSLSLPLSCVLQELDNAESDLSPALDSGSAPLSFFTRAPRI